MSLGKYHTLQLERTRRKKEAISYYQRLHQPIPRQIQMVNIYEPTCSGEAQSVFEQWPFPNIFIISIRPKRLKACLKRLGVLGCLVTILPGCNGETIDRHLWRREGTIKRNCNMTSGTLGCFESHCRIWRYVVEKNLESALVLEDDVRLYPTATCLSRILEGLLDIQKYNLSWDMLFLGRSHKKHQNLKRLTPRITIPSQFWGMFAYVIKNTCARRLLHRKEIQTYSLPIDVVISRLGRRGKLKLLAFDPQVCGQINALSDTRNIT